MSNKKEDNEIQETWDEFNADYMGGHKLSEKEVYRSVYL
jgi:hypothetical protein